MTKATLDFATATNTDLPRSAEVVGNTLNAFQLGSRETTRVVNVMNESFSRSALDTEKFSLAIGKVGAVAAASNFSLEKTTATLGVLESNGIRADIWKTKCSRSTYYGYNARRKQRVNRTIRKAR